MLLVYGVFSYVNYTPYGINTPYTSNILTGLSC